MKIGVEIELGGGELPKAGAGLRSLQSLSFLAAYSSRRLDIDVSSANPAWITVLPHSFLRAHAIASWKMVYMTKVARYLRVLIPTVFIGALAIAPVQSAPPSDAALKRQFNETVRPFVTQYCFGCHGTKKPAAQLDLRLYSTMETVTADLSRWRQVHEKLNAGQMPPAKMPQPPPALRKQVVDWIQEVTRREALKHAGDPGPVLTRRLSNAEYNNTIRDLTGVDIQPAREFPVDPANTEGFDNSGESLVMSPSLFNKYLQAARQVSEHMVLKPEGFDFAPYPMLAATDRDRYSIQRILDFYARQPTDYAAYFEAAWRYRYRAALGRPTATLADMAAESRISAKYLPLIWKILQEP